MKLTQRARRRTRLLIRSQLIKGRFVSRAFRRSPVAGNEASVLMCLWNRPTRIGPVLRMLDAQDFPDGVRLFLWNNNRSDHDLYVDALSEFQGRTDGTLRRIDLVKSPHNLGSIARFYWARKLSKSRPDAPIIVIDDDQDFPPSFVREAMELYDPAVVRAWWAWTVGDAYWDRLPAEQGGPVDHIGPGGMVCSSRIFADSRFFTDIPDEFRLLDDVWLTYFAKREGYSLAKLPAEIGFVMDETNQHHGQAELKARFYDYLYRTGATP